MSEHEKHLVEASARVRQAEEAERAADWEHERLSRELQLATERAALCATLTRQAWQELRAVVRTGQGDAAEAGEPSRLSEGSA